jgi:hypothetical protein
LDVIASRSNGLFGIMNIEVEQGGETFYYKERAFFHDGKLKVSGEDPYIQYRDGKMNVKYNK